MNLMRREGDAAVNRTDLDLELETGLCRWRNSRMYRAAF